MVFVRLKEVEIGLLYVANYETGGKAGRSRTEQSSKAEYV